MEDLHIVLSDPLQESPNIPGTPAAPSSEVADIWNRSLETIRGRINTQSFKTWFEPIVPLRLNGRIFSIQVPSQFFYDWLEEHYYSLINESMTKVVGTEIVLDCVVAPEDREQPRSIDQTMPASLTASIELSPVSMPSTGRKFSDRMPETPRPAPLPLLQPCLNPRYTFDNYIKGESNQFARAAALAVSNNPGGTSFNPLVIYGGVGLGKTHLVHAIGNHVLKLDKTKRVLYVSSEKFTVDFVDAIQKDNVSEFSNYYRSVDVLIVDDIQFLAGKEKTQDVFFHTFNALYHLGKQIVLSSDKPPKDLKGLNDRLISRFQWGLTADIQPPDLETRIAILQHKSLAEGYELSHDVMECIASNVTSNVREMEGCLISIFARASLENRQIDLPLVRDVVRSVVGEVRTHITIEDIQKMVSEHLGISEDLIRAKTRKQEIVNARQIAMYLAKELTNSSLKTIGLHFGGRDHSTVIHAYQAVEDSMGINAQQKFLVDQLRSKLERGTR